MTPSCRFSRFRDLAVVLAAALAAHSALADPNPKQAAACVAALQARAEPIAQRMREGDTSAEAQLLPVVTSSFAFVGVVYKQGIRGAEADALLKEAEKAQAGLPPAELEHTQNACQTQGEGLLKNASFFERQFVNRAARKRVDRLRKPPAA
jgi:hypothetical protein